MLSALAYLAAAILSFVSVLFEQPKPATPEGDRAKTSVRDDAGEREERAKDSASLQRRTWMVGGVERVALLRIPEGAKATASPVVFAFHGHGGNARNAARSFRMHELWPEAIVVYMEGLPTPGMTDPEGKKNGWQNREGQQGDRDLAFFDAVLASLRTDCRVDDRRIFATGHSNGGGFTYLLWRSRADVFAAFAPSAAGGARLGTLAPKPAMHIAGKSDELVRFALQEKSMEAIKRANACDEQGQAWAADCTLYASKKGTPFVAFIHDGGHKYPSEAPALIVRFFKEQVREEAGDAKKER